VEHHSIYVPYAAADGNASQVAPLMPLRQTPSFMLDKKKCSANRINVGFQQRLE
jgi:hypothetical protein